MRPLVSSLILVGTLIGTPAALCAQQDQNQRLEARRLLLQASSLVNDIPESQQPSAAANIAGQLIRTGDLDDALTITRLITRTDDRALVTGIVAWRLVKFGNVPEAFTT